MYDFKEIRKRIDKVELSIKKYKEEPSTIPTLTYAELVRLEIELCRLKLEYNTYKVLFMNLKGEEDL